MISKRSQELLLQSDSYELVKVLDREASAIHHNITQAYIDSHELYVCKFKVGQTWFYIMETHDYYRYVFDGCDSAVQFITNINPKHKKTDFV